MKKAILSCLMLLAGLTASAQEQKGTTEYVFEPHWYVNIQPLGIQYTLGEVDFGDLLSYNIQAAAVNRAIELVQEALNYAQGGQLYKNKIADRVLNYSVKLDKWLSENFNHALQPTLFAIHGAKDGSKILQTLDTTNAKLNRVSGVKGSPLAVEGGKPVVLKATSYTLETFCPILRKFVTISEIDGVAQTAAEAESKSEGGAKFGHVVYSYNDQYQFTPEKGKTYTILYEAVDYFGNTFSKEYYIKGE